MAVVAVLAAACAGDAGISTSSTESTATPTESTESTATPTDTDDPSPTPTPRNGPIMVAAGPERETLLLVDPTDGSTRTIEHPAHLVGNPTVLRGAGGPGGEYAVVITSQDAYVFEVATGAVQHSSPLGDTLGASPRPVPEAALFVRGDQLTVADLRTGTIIDAGPSDPGLARLDVDADARTALVSRGSGGGELVDLDAGTSKTIADELFLIGDALDPTGRRVAATRRGSGPVDRQIVVFGVDDPETMAVWYEPATAEGQLSGYAWTGDVIVAIDFTGRVFVLDGAEPDEIGRIGDGEVAPFRLHGGETAAAVLASNATPEGERWYRIDPTSRDIQPLPELDGLVPLGGERLPDALILGDGDGVSDWSRVVVAPIDVGDAVEIVASDAPQTLSVTGVGGDVVRVTLIEFRLRTFSYVDAGDGTVVGEGTSSGAMVISPDLGQVAVVPDGTAPTVVVHELADPASGREVGAGAAVAWLEDPR